jgi:hypothetical protein
MHEIKKTGRKENKLDKTREGRQGGRRAEERKNERKCISLLP